MGRKRNQGKARRAAKVKAREEAAQQAASGNSNNPTANNERQKLPKAEEQEQESSITNELQLLALGMICTHGFNPHSENFCLEFKNTFRREFYQCPDGSSLASGLENTKKATLTEFADVWNDSVKMKIVISMYLCDGTQIILENKYGNAGDHATFVRFLEQHIAVELEQSQALVNWPKVDDTYNADEHTLVKFFRRRIPCSCLDEKYEEVKHITKKGICYYPQCSIPGRVKRSKAKYCSRCRCVTYCSRECQVADWSRHKLLCDMYVSKIDEFAAKQQEMWASHWGWCLKLFFSQYVSVSTAE